ncbi:hypothetical protein PMIN02_000192 [Paraphaeosphaeria minitans]
MRFSYFLAYSLASLLSTSAVSLENDNPVGASITLPRYNLLPRLPWSNHKHHKDNWGNRVEKDRKRITIRSSRNDHDDISADFLWALKKANHGGLVHLQKGKKYLIGKNLDLTFLNDVCVKLNGEVKFTNDIQDVKIYGSGVTNCNGQAWWDGFSGAEIPDPKNKYFRPILVLTDNATNIEVSGLHLKDSPCWTTFFVRSKNVVFDDVYIDAVSTNASTLPKNTDGFYSLNVDGLTVTNTRVNVGDDCFSPKPNTTSIFVKNLWCNGTHGVSMGSIGQYPGVKDYISNAWIENVTQLNGQNGARLKDIRIENTHAPVVLNQCYFNVNEMTCAAYLSKVNITNVIFLNVSGTRSGKNGKVVADHTCSPGATCNGIHLEDINLTSPAGSPSQIVCDNIQGDIGVDCIPASEADD